MPDLNKDTQNISRNDFSDFFDDDGTVNNNTATAVQENADIQIDQEQTTVPTKESKKIKEAKQPKTTKEHKKKSKSKQDIQNTKPEMVLYIIVDKPIPGLINYLRGYGIKVSSVFHSLPEVKNVLLMQSEPTRIVVIDSGLGKFTTTAMRAELIDMLGISDDQNKTTVFFTDSVIKVDTLRSLGKSGKLIDWIPYKSTAIVAATIIGYNETYKYDSEDSDDEIETEAEILRFRGRDAGIEDTPRERMSSFSSESIMVNLVENTNKDELIPGFKVRL